jgi:hypothetical protein
MGGRACEPAKSYQNRFSKAMTGFANVDDKFVPLYRVIWVSAVPHFCGNDDCEREGHYEVRLEQGESVWARSEAERDQVLEALQHWQGGPPHEEEENWE